MTGNLLTPQSTALTKKGESARHFTTWTRDLQHALESIEKRAFAPELRYTFPEMLERADRAGFEGLLLTDINGPAAVLFVYHLADVHHLYLDTLAVCERRHGTGSRLLQFLIDRCIQTGVSEIKLDTEAGDPGSGPDLPAFYRRFGFEEPPATEKPGNVTMRLSLATNTADTAVITRETQT